MFSLTYEVINKRVPCNAKVLVQAENYKVNVNSNTYIRVSIFKMKIAGLTLPKRGIFSDNDNH